MMTEKNLPDAGRLIEGYENTGYHHYEELGEDFPNSIWYDELPDREVTGVLKACRYVNGRLLQTYSEKENHVGVIAATRLGKTTSYVIPAVLSFARAKNKKSMIISDPRGRSTAIPPPRSRGRDTASSSSISATTGIRSAGTP